MHGEYPDNERRKFQRLKVQITIIYQVNRPLYVRVLIGNKEIEAITLDLSEGGMALLTDYDIPVASALSMEFMIYEVDKRNNFRFYKSIKVIGEVASNILLEDNKRRLGICFTLIDEVTKSEIKNFVEKGISFPKLEPPPEAVS